MNDASLPSLRKDARSLRGCRITPDFLGPSAGKEVANDASTGSGNWRIWSCVSSCKVSRRGTCGSARSRLLMRCTLMPERAAISLSRTRF